MRDRPTRVRYSDDLPEKSYILPLEKKLTQETRYE